MAHLLCEEDVACCAGRGLAVDENKCAAWRRQSYDRCDPFPGNCETREEAEAVSRGYDANAARVCLAEIARNTQACLAPLRADDPAKARVDRACESVYPATRESLPGPGQACDGTCAAPGGKVSVCERIYDAPVYGYCGSAQTARKKGESCGPGCAQDLICLKDRVCGSPQPDGSACDRDAQCLSGYCDYDTDVCMAPPPSTEQHCRHLQAVSTYQISFELTDPEDRSLGINGLQVFWPSRQDSRSIQFAPKDGSGPLASITAYSVFSWRTLVDDDYFYEQVEGRVQRTSLKSGSSEVLVSVPKGGPLSWGALALDGGDLLLVGGACEAVARVNLASPRFTEPSTVLASPPSSATSQASELSLAVEAQTVYCAFRNRLAAFFQDGSAQVLTEQATMDDAGGIQQLEILDGRLYYSAPGKLFMFDRATGTATRLPAPIPPTSRWGSSEPPPSLKLARGRLFWSATGAIQSYDIRQGTFASIEVGDVLSEFDTQLAVDAEFIYWMTGVGVFRRALD